jgi:membrane associated rhomboid family serine protease
MGDKLKLIKSIIFPAVFVLLLWLIHILSTVLNIQTYILGIYPLKASGLIGIATSPLIHEDYSHLSANSVPLLVLGGCLFYFYREIAYKVFFLIYIITNIWVWSFARESYHIGASGIVYGLASFLFISGIIRRHNQLMAISMLVVFLYGGIIWGVFPKFFPEKNISWESHLSGIICGIIIALFFRNEGPQRKVYEWEQEDEFSDEEEVNDFLDRNYSPLRSISRFESFFLRVSRLS